MQKHQHVQLFTWETLILVLVLSASILALGMQQQRIRMLEKQKLPAPTNVTANYQQSSQTDELAQINQERFTDESSQYKDYRALVKSSLPYFGSKEKMLQTLLLADSRFVLGPRFNANTYYDQPGHGVKDIQIKKSIKSPDGKMTLHIFTGDWIDASGPIGVPLGFFVEKDGGLVMYHIREPAEGNLTDINWFDNKTVIAHEIGDGPPSTKYSIVFNKLGVSVQETVAR